MAFTQTNARLIARLLLDRAARLHHARASSRSTPQGAQGALLQMVNHGLVVAPLFFIIALLAERAGGSEDIRDMGGIAFRAPVLAALFLIVALATLAMPGSANFVGEFLILLGVFNAKLAIAIIAFTGVVLRQRLHAARCSSARCTTASGRAVDVVRDERRATALVLVPLVLVILALRALSAAGALERTSEPTRQARRSRRAPVAGRRRDAPAADAARCSADERGRSPPPTVKGPHIDWRGALAAARADSAARCVVLLVGLLRARVRARTRVVPVLTLVALGAAAGLAIWQWDDSKLDRRGRAARSTTSRCVLTLCSASPAAARRAALVALARAPREAGARRVPRAAADAVARHGRARRARRTWSRCSSASSCCRSRCTCCARRELRREHSLESGLKYLIIGSVGSATLLYGLALIYGATGATDFAGDRARAVGGDVSSDPLLLTGIALSSAGLAFKASVAPFHQWTPDVYEGAPTPITAFMAVATKAAAFGVILRLLRRRADRRAARLGRRRSPRSRRSRSWSATWARSGSPR